MPSTRDTHVTRFEPLIVPDELSNRLPVPASVEQHVIEARETIRKIIYGEDPRLLLITGPCSIHNTEAATEYAGRLKALAEEVSDQIYVVMRVYFEKPRTTVGWKGLIYDPHLDGSDDLATGLYTAREFLLKVNEMGLPAATEFLDPFVPQYISSLISWAAIGARTTESQTHRQLASGLSMPVGFKNATSGNTQVAVDAIMSAASPHNFLGITYDGRAAMVQTTGNQSCHVVLRGGHGGPNYDAGSIDLVSRQLEKAGLQQGIIVDCSHANSNKDHTRQPGVFREVLRQRTEGDARIVGVMLESHLNPGNQSLGDDPSALQYGISITDACIGWDDTAEVVREARARLNELVTV